MFIKLVIFLILVKVIYLNSDVQFTTSSTSKIRIEEDDSSKWNGLSKRLVQLMTNSDRKHKYEIDATIFLAETTTKSYAGFYQAIMRHSDIKITFNMFILRADLKKIQMQRTFQDFLIILLNENVINYVNFINIVFNPIFEDKSLKIFVILSYNRSFKNAIDVWNALIIKKYYNLYVLLHEKSGKFKVCRTGLTNVGNSQIQFLLRQTHGHKFLMIKDDIKRNELDLIKIIFFDFYPLSYVDDEVIIGTDGRLIQEFSKKLKTPYKVMNDHKLKPTTMQVYNNLETRGDISLYTQINIVSPNIQFIPLNQMHGLCLLTPRNIPVSSHEHFAFPVDCASIILTLLSALSVIICWKLISSDMSLMSIAFATFELALNFGSSSINKLSLSESLLVYCFIFSSFFLITLYESTSISFEFNDMTWRSAHSFEELNASNNKFYSYFDEKIVEQSNLPKIRRDLIMNYIDVFDTFKMNLPDDLDMNLVYTLHCDIVDYFMKSPRNYRNGRQLFDKISVTQFIKTYNVKSGYFYIDEFKKLVSNLMESGIYDFWKNNDSTELTDDNKIDLQSDHLLLALAEIIVPISILGFGCLIALIVLMIELVVEKWKFQRSRNNLHVHTTRKKLNLNKWMQKLHYKRKSKIDKFNKSQKAHSIPSRCQFSFIPSKLNDKEFLKCRENFKGNVFAMKLFKEINKQKHKGLRFVQVQPHNLQAEND
ncbi:hypothetical protein ACKWTF_013397 [Chironomus riparius]